MRSAEGAAPPLMQAPASAAGRSGWLDAGFWGGWKFAAGVILCASPLGALAVAGWAARFAQRAALVAWFRRGRRPGERFEEFALGSPALQDHQHAPNWLLAQRFSARAYPSLRSFLRGLAASLLCNLKIGVQMIWNAWAVTLPATALMLFSWYAGWQNSFHKGYEHHAVGMALGAAGILLLIPVLLYLPMAQMRQAVSGDWRMFYRFRSNLLLIRRTAWRQLGLALLYFLVSLGLTAWMVGLLFWGLSPEWEALPPEQVRTQVRNAYLATGLLLFPGYVGLRWVSAKIYAGALLKAVRSGALAEEDLSRVEWETLGRLGLLTPNLSSPRGWTRPLRWPVWPALVLVWFGFVAQIYIHQFFNTRWLGGWLNQPLLHLPCSTLADPDSREP